jgi:AP-1 complex subunit beta-1
MQTGALYWLLFRQVYSSLAHLPELIASFINPTMQVIMVHMRNVRREDLVKQLVRKMAPPLVTLLSSPPEVQWVALRNVNLLLQKRPDVLSNEMRVFFCKYNDPLYVKVEKLDIMVRLASDNNVDALLSELKEYVGSFSTIESYSL